MKKFIAILLAAMLVVPAMLAFAVSADEAPANLALNKTYTIDTGNKTVDGTWNANITDGNSEADFANNAVWFGLNRTAHGEGESGSEYASFTIDLGEKATIGSTKVNFGKELGWGIGVSEKIAISVSTDGENFTSVGEFATPAVEDKSSAWGEFTFDAVEAQYVRYTMSFVPEKAWLFVNEVEIYAGEAAVQWNEFWVTHFNDNTAEGAGTIFTEAYTGAGWWLHVSFKPVEGKANVYEVVETSDGTPDGNGTALAIPEGGFVFASNYGNDYITLNNDPNATNYVTKGAGDIIAAFKALKAGDKITVKGVDLEGKTIPTSTPEKNWYDPEYVCTAEYALGEVTDSGKTVIKEEITVDGDVNDTGWDPEKWIEVTTENGTVQEADTGDDTLSYKFQIRTDDTKVYVAFISLLREGPPRTLHHGGIHRRQNRLLRWDLQRRRRRRLLHDRPFPGRGRRNRERA